MNRRKQEALILLTVFLSCGLGLYLVAISNNMHSNSLSPRSSEPWYDSDWDYNYSRSVLYPSPTPGVDSTCQALRQLIMTSPIAFCTTNDECNGIHCSVTGVGSFDLTVEPCRNPPAVNVVGKDPFENVIFNQTLTDSHQESIGLATINVNITESPNEDSILISVSAHFLGAPTALPIVPETRIPLNRDQCSFIPHTPTPPRPTPTHSHPLTPTPEVNPTCQALRQLANVYPFCSTISQQCTSLHCEVLLLGSFDLTVEPCQSPPAVQVVGMDSNGRVVFNRTLVDTHREELVPGTFLDITIRHSADDDSIIISVSYTLAGISTTLIPDTRIPLNRQQCGFTPRPRPSSTAVRVDRLSTSTPPHHHRTTRHHPHPSKPSLSHTSTHGYPLQSGKPSQPSRPLKQVSTTVPMVDTSTSSSVVMVPSTKPPPAGASSSLTVAVAVPVSVILCLIGIVVLVAAIVMIMRRRKRLRREYHFQRMTFDSDKDDDDDDEDL